MKRIAAIIVLGLSASLAIGLASGYVRIIGHGDKYTQGLFIEVGGANGHLIACVRTRLYDHSYIGYYAPGPKLGACDFAIAKTHGSVVLQIAGPSGLKFYTIFP